MLTDDVVGVLTMSSRSGIGRRDTYWLVRTLVCVADDTYSCGGHIVREIEP